MVMLIASLVSVKFVLNMIGLSVGSHFSDKSKSILSKSLLPQWILYL